MAILVYKYGLPSRWEPTEEIAEQFHLANQLRNELVQIEYDHDTAMATMWSQHPAIARTEEELAEALADLEKATSEAKLQRQTTRSRKTSTTQSKLITAARKRVAQAKVARRAAISETYEIAKPQIEEIRERRKVAIKATYTNRGDLYWATCNAVTAHHKTATARVASDRAKGLPAERRIKRFDGSGTITVQPQREATDPPRTPQLLSSGTGKWRNTITLPTIAAMDPTDHAKLSRGEKRRAGRTEITLTYGAGKTFTFPAQIHRPLPPDADVCLVQLTRRRVASHMQTTVAITIKIPDPTPPPDGIAAALHLGWRTQPDGSIRVATIQATDNLTPPPAILAACVTGSGTQFEVHVPTSLLTITERPSLVQGQRDTNLAPRIEQLATWMETQPQLWQGEEAPHPRWAPANIRRWTSAGRLAAVVIAWRDDPAILSLDGGANLMAKLEAWRKQDKHLWEWQANERQQTTRHRDDMWRCVGAWLAGQTSTIVVDDTDLRELRRREDITETDPALPGIASDRARSHAVIAAPGSLRERVIMAAKRRGVPVETVKASGLSRTHTTCGHENPQDPQYAASSSVLCSGCGAVYEQDRNAARMMLTRAVRCTIILA